MVAAGLSNCQTSGTITSRKPRRMRANAAFLSQWFTSRPSASRGFRTSDAAPGNRPGSEARRERSHAARDAPARP